MGRVDRGLSVLTGSVGVFRANPRVALLPLCSVLVMASGFAVAGGLALYTGLAGALAGSDLALYAAIFAGLALTSSLGTFFNAAVVHCVAQYFRGEEPRLRDGLEAAWEARRAIALWALTSATVGTTLAVLRDKLGIGGYLANWLFSMAWGLVTFFVVPVIVLEDAPGIRSILRESGETFRDTWGESVTATVGVGLLFLPLTLGGLVALAVAFFLFGGPTAWLVGGLGLVAFAAGVVASQVVGMIARTALYEYATRDRHVGPLAERDPEAFFPTD